MIKLLSLIISVLFQAEQSESKRKEIKSNTSSQLDVPRSPVLARHFRSGNLRSHSGAAYQNSGSGFPGKSDRRRTCVREKSGLPPVIPRSAWKLSPAFGLAPPVSIR